MKDLQTVFRTVVIIFGISFLCTSMGSSFLHAADYEQKGRLKEIIQQNALSSIQIPQAIEEFRKYRTQRVVTIGILSTGIDTSVPELKGRIVGGASFVKQEPDVHDYHGLGTFHATLIAAIAPTAKILPIKVLNKKGRSSIATVIKGINFAVNQEVEILYLSAGVMKGTEVLLKKLKDAVTKVRERGILFIAPAGNSGTSKLTYPACFKGVLAVGATDDRDKKAAFSNFGNWVSLYSPGVSVKSVFKNDRFIPLSGTTVAAAGTTGVAALILATSPNLGPSDAEKILLNTGTDISHKNPELGGGARRVNALSAVRSAKSFIN